MGGKAFTAQVANQTSQQAAQQGAAPDRLQPTLVPRSGFRRRVSLVVLPVRTAWMRFRQQNSTMKDYE